MAWGSDPAHPPPVSVSQVLRKQPCIVCGCFHATSAELRRPSDPQSLNIYYLGLYTKSLLSLDLDRVPTLLVLYVRNVRPGRRNDVATLINRTDTRDLHCPVSLL